MTVARSRRDTGPVLKTPQLMLAGAVALLDTGADPQRLVDIAIAYVEKWARLAEEWDAHGDRAPILMDGRASIYTGETYAQARDRWQTYLELLNDHLRGVEGGLAS